MHTAESNRLSSALTVDSVRASVEEHLAYLDQEIKRTEKLIREHITNHPGLKRQSELLDSIPGIGETTAATLLAELPDTTQYKSARQVAAFAGLVPPPSCRMTSALFAVRFKHLFGGGTTGT